MNVTKVVCTCFVTPATCVISAPRTGISDNQSVGESYSKSRRWQRLAIAFPVFVHGTDAEGRPVLEFGTAINVSAGGALIAVKRVPSDKEIMIEMPVPPGFVAHAPASHRLIKGRIVRSHSGSAHTYLGLEFKKPLSVR